MTIESPTVSEVNIEVAIALPERQEIMALKVPLGTTARDAVEQSGLVRKYAGFLDTDLSLGIFSRLLNGAVLPLPEDYVMEENDRVEIYRPLAKDPKQARLERAARAKTESRKK